MRLRNSEGLITSQYYKILAQAHHDQPLIDHILKKTGWAMSIFQGVDWESHHQAFHRLTRFQRIGVTKMVHNLSNTNRQNHLLYGTSDRCPCCRAEEETFEHVLRCPSEATLNHRHEALGRLEKSLETMGTPHQVIGVIKEGFRDWLDPEFPSNRRSRPSTFGSLRPADILLTKAYYTQFYTIGWYHFCLGRISREWHAAVQAFLPPNQPHRPLPWGSNLVPALWLFTKSLWLHRNTLVHGADAEESAQRILTGLRDQVRQHYFAFKADESYVLARHRYLFTSHTLDQRLSLSYDNVTCWLRSVDEARHQLATKVAYQQLYAT